MGWDGSVPGECGFLNAPWTATLRYDATILHVSPGPFPFFPCYLLVMGEFFSSKVVVGSVRFGWVPVSTIGAESYPDFCRSRCGGRTGEETIAEESRGKGTNPVRGAVPFFFFARPS